MNGHVEVTSYLLDQGAKINGRTRPYSRTALHYACINGHLGMVELLRERERSVVVLDPFAARWVTLVLIHRCRTLLGFGSFVTVTVGIESLV